MKNLIRNIPRGSCPKCGHRQFIVKELISNLYLTNEDGEVIDYNEDMHYAKGICMNCHKEYEMFVGNNSFIPLTPLRKLLLEDVVEAEIIEEQVEDIENPFDRS